jgi:enamine deaminase RidA (YjgF/YER057c/UK114 family)
MKLHVKQCTEAKSAAGEVFVTIDAEDGDDVPRLFEQAVDALSNCGAQLVRERLFIPTGKVSAYQSASRRAFPSPHARAELHAGSNGVAGGIQLHGVRSGSDLTHITDERGEVRGVTLSCENTKWVFTSAVCVPLGDGPEETRACFDFTERLLRSAGLTLHDIARTWIYLDHILAWYPQFNQARNRVFIEQGLLQKGEDPANLRVPASTGMGVRPVVPGRISLEAIAVAGDDARLRKRAAAGAQRSAFEYGSAFARVAECRSLAGRTVYISGTAAIDSSGATCHKGDVTGQIRMTLENIAAVLSNCDMTPQNVVEAIAYCKSPDIALEFCRSWRNEVRWPWLVVVGDVCRDDLLFEAEVTAVETL